MKLAVLKETNPGERRVALTPESVQRLVKKGHAVAVQTGAGVSASHSDDEYTEAGATVSDSPEGDVLLRVNAPDADAVPEGKLLVCLINPMIEHDRVKALAARKVTSIAVDMIPRTTLAQSMDVLSSQANIAGYWAVLAAATKLPKFFPMLMTAAGTISPAKVLVLGAGVAGLQAIATARRLGAVVEAFDVRKVVKEQVMSLGAKFVEVDSEEDAAGAGGYAKEVSEEYKKKQGELVHKHVAKSDVAITTALIPGKKAPVLITEAMVKEMRPGSVIVDLACERGGNVEGSEADKEVVKHGVTIIGHTNIPSFVAVHASQLYGKNMESLLKHLSTKEGELKLDMEDEITKGCVITKDGEVVHARIREMIG